jgi:hypothetical protein
MSDLDAQAQRARDVGRRLRAYAPLDQAAKFTHKFMAKTPRGHKGQVRWLTSANQPVNVLIPGNRFGKSVVEAMRHIHHCVFKVGIENPKRSTPYETISVSVSADQAEIVFNEAKTLLSAPQAKPLVKRIYATPFPRIVFYNGSVMHCRSAHDDGKYIDGHAYRLVSIDEAGWLKNELKKLMNGVIIMRLAGGGMIDLIGTPKGYTDLYWYANRGLRGVPGYYTQRGSIYDNPYLSAEDLKVRDELLAQADPRLREQVLYGAFVSDTGMAFTQDQLDQAFQQGLPAHQDYVPEHRYIQAWDLGRRTDWTVGVTFDVTNPDVWTMVDFVRLNKVPWEHIYDLIRRKSVEYRVQMPIIDATGPGGDVIEEELTKRGVFVDPAKTETLQAKTDLINTLQTAMDHRRRAIGVRTVLDEAGFPRQVPDMDPPGGDWGLLRMPPIPQLLDEFGGYELMDKKLVQDCVMAVALAVGAAYDGASLDKPTAGGLYGGGEVVESVGFCAICQQLFPKDDLAVVTDSLLGGKTVEMCQACYDLRAGVGVAA